MTVVIVVIVVVFVVVVIVACGIVVVQVIGPMIAGVIDVLMMITAVLVVVEGLGLAGLNGRETRLGLVVLRITVRMLVRSARRGGR